MEVEVLDPESGETIFVHISEEQACNLEELKRERASDSKLDSFIDNLDISADAKAIISDIKKSTIKIGNSIIKVGKRIIEIVLAIMRKFPNTTFGFILGIIISALIGSIPIMGILFGAIAPLIVAAFTLGGALEDVKDKALVRKIAEATAMFEPLKGDT